MNIKRKPLARKKEFPAESCSIEDILDFSEECLREGDINEQLMLEYRLVIEMVAEKMIRQADRGGTLRVEGYRRVNGVYLRLSCPGKPVVLDAADNNDIHGLIIEEYQDYMRQSYSSGTNLVDFSTSSNDLIKRSNLIAILLSVIVAVILRILCPKDITDYLTESLIYPINRFYVGCMQAIASPVVFLSTVTLFVKLQYRFDHNTKLLYTFMKYILTSLIAIGISFLVWRLLPVSNILPDLSSLKAVGVMSDVRTLKDFVEMFTFSNLIEIFTMTNPIPMLFLAILFGLAISSVLGTEGECGRRGVTALSSLFSRMLCILYDMMPFFLFFAMLPNWINDGVYFLLENIMIIVLFIILVLLMFVVYALELRMARVSVRQFLTEYGEILKENFRIGSNIDALPYNKRMLGRKTKMDPFRLKDRLSLGAMVNMDGNCLVISGSALFMMYACGISITPGIIACISLITILLSIGAPNQPGSFLVGMIFLMNFIGVSSDMYDIVIVTEALLGGVYSFVNSAGDIVTIAAETAAAERQQK